MTDVERQNPQSTIRVPRLEAHWEVTVSVGGSNSQINFFSRAVAPLRTPAASWRVCSGKGEPGVQGLDGYLGSGGAEKGAPKKIWKGLWGGSVQGPRRERGVSCRAA